MSYYNDYFDPVKFGSLHKLISVKLPRYGDTKIDVLKVRPISHWIEQFHNFCWTESLFEARVSWFEACTWLVHSNELLSLHILYLFCVTGAKEIDIAATVEHLRDQRPSMVKTKVKLIWFRYTCAVPNYFQHC